MIRRKFLALSAAILSIVAASASPAKADFQARYSLDNGTTWTTAALQAGGPGNILYINIGQSVLTLTATSSAQSTTGFTSLDLSINGNLSGNFTGANAIIVQASVNNIATVAPGAATFAMTGSIIPSGAVVMQSWAGGNNTLFSTTGAGTSGSVTLPPGQPFPPGGMFLVPGGTNPYSAMVQTIFNQNYAQGTSFSTDNNLQIRPVPAPAGLVLALSGVPIAGLAWLRRRKVVA